jgi:hypothetical protein
MIVSRTLTSKINEDGSIEGMMIGGSTTASFPNSVVILENRLSGSPLDMTIKRAIREYLANECIRGQDITVYDLASRDLLWDDGRLEAKEVNQDLVTDRLKLAYRLRVEPAWINEEGFGAALQLWMSWENLFEVREVGAQNPERQVLDERITVKFGQTSLVGFRLDGKRLRASVCWLAISVDQK